MGMKYGLPATIISGYVTASHHFSALQSVTFYIITHANKLVFKVPMVAPFMGCTFGGWIYDVFLYTGLDSPINTPWMGLNRMFVPLSRKRVILSSPA